ncbi:MAG: ABC transporter ATP-binding protein [Acidimicrobiia bacterium]|nr:ABC transporter ATP-binding protein [Acidimicrobiia bacterium]MYB11366.1 ABC transporter ATP-binding protein [Acidimicrobiia bacterium]MYG58517.1 ABC transporter ATP-binding protein [Acidimicrobiia bacterium]MYG71414.1 ABC transporter ATP-binding protein [Acidimicrobiia bacterium]MYH96971.1 ABC transporter ATP-binding protein [Acidimicrobiia bacterium]
MKRLWPMVRAYRRTMLIGVVTGVVALAIQAAVPALGRSAVDAAIEGNRGALWLVFGLTAAFGIGRLVFGGIYRYQLFKLGWNVETDLRAIMYEHLTRLSFSYYDRTQSGEVISRANSDIRSLQLLLAFGPLVSMNVLMFVMALGFMVYVHPWLALVALAPLPGVYWFGLKFRNQVFPLSWVTQARMADLATIVDENVNGTRVVKSFAAEERQIALLGRSAQRIYWTNVEIANSRSRWNPLIESLPRLGTAMVVLYGGWLAIEGVVSIGTLLAFSAYVIMLQVPFRMAGFMLMQGQRASAAAQRIYEILDEPPQIVDSPTAVDIVDPRGEVDFEGVSFGYNPDTPVLDDFTLHIEPGERVAIVGSTGTGKSTVARLLDRFYDVDGGSVRIDGLDVRDVTLRSLRHTVGLVLDEPFLFSASVHDNIAYARPDAPRSDVVKAATAAQAHGFISELEHGYDSVIGERGYTLSGGQRQRIAIARTLLANPKVLVLDDATSAIDVTVEEAIHKALQELMANRTTIIIAHRLSTISLAERVVVLNQGRVANTGTHTELLATDPHYVEILARHSDDELDGVSGNGKGDRTTARRFDNEMPGFPKSGDEPWTFGGGG